MSQDSNFVVFLAIEYYFLYLNVEYIS